MIMDTLVTRFESSTLLSNGYQHNSSVLPMDYIGILLSGSLMYKYCTHSTGEVPKLSLLSLSRLILAILVSLLFFLMLCILVRLVLLFYLVCAVISIVELLFFLYIDTDKGVRHPL